MVDWPLVLSNVENRGESMEQVHIAFCADANVFPYLGVAIKSIINCSSEKYKYVIHVIYDEVDYLSEGLLRSEFNEVSNFELHLVNVKNYENLLNGVYTSGYLTMAAYWRLILPLLLPNVNRVLYLDVDTLVLKDVSKLFFVDLDGFELAGCIDYGIGYSEEAFYKKGKVNLLKLKGFSDFKRYINSGVLVMNLQAFRGNDRVNQLLELIHNNDFQFHDQDALNVLFDGNIKILNNRWNFNVDSNLAVYTKSAIEDIERRISCMDISIIHYVGRRKPWLLEEGMLRGLWAKVALQTPFFAASFLGTETEFTAVMNKSKKNCQKRFMKKIEKILIPDFVHKIKRYIKNI